MSRRFDGDDDGLLDPFGDELDLAETIARENPTADQLQHFANLRGAKHARQNAEAPFVTNNPASAMKGSLGNQAIVTAPAPGIPASAGLKQIANWPGQDSETRPVTVTLFPIFQELPVGTARGVRPYGIVQFGTYGSLAQAEVDIGTGVQFTVSGSAVTVQAGLDAHPLLTGVQQMIIGGMLSFEPIMKNWAATRTRYIDIAAPGTQQIVTIPPFARSFVFIPQSTSSPWTLEFRDSATAGCGAVVYGTTTLAQEPLTIGVPVPNDATSVAVTCSGVNGGTGRLIFNLSF